MKTFTLTMSALNTMLVKKLSVACQLFDNKAANTAVTSVESLNTEDLALIVGGNAASDVADLYSQQSVSEGTIIIED